MKSSPRPKPRPENPAIMKKSPRPRTRSDKEFEDEMGATIERGNRNSQPPGRMANGGKCRGMGAAKRGGKYGKSG